MVFRLNFFAALWVQSTPRFTIYLSTRDVFFLSPPLIREYLLARIARWNAASHTTELSTVAECVSTAAAQIRQLNAEGVRCIALLTAGILNFPL